MEQEHEDGVAENAGEDSDEDNGKIHGDVNDHVNGENDDETDSDVDNLEVRVNVRTINKLRFQFDVQLVNTEAITLDTARGHVMSDPYVMRAAEAIKLEPVQRVQVFPPVIGGVVVHQLVFFVLMNDLDEWIERHQKLIGVNFLKNNNYDLKANHKVKVRNLRRIVYKCHCSGKKRSAPLNANAAVEGEPSKKRRKVQAASIKQDCHAKLCCVLNERSKLDGSPVRVWCITYSFQHSHPLAKSDGVRAQHLSMAAKYISMDPYSRSSNGKGSNGSGISNSNNSLNNNNNTGSNGPVPNDSVELLLQNDNDPMDDAFHREESHYRRSSFHHSDNRENNDDGRDRRDSRDRGVEGAKRGTRGRSRSPDRSREHHSGSARNQHDRDDKYDGERRSSHHEHDRSARGGRSRSRSPSRFGSGSSAMRDRRVYVGNLSYDVKWTNLKDFMRQIGPVAHADVLLGPDGRSKGCGVVEYSSADDARESIRKLNDVVLMGRPVFVREDRESEARIGFSGGRNSGVPSRGGEGNTRQIYVANLPYSVNWKDMKDLFRRAGPVDRADVFMTQDMRSKGSGTVMFERASDVSRAVGT
ncbi:hypothetical protein BGX31_002020 [Mortierella sp. GBA43]|nr:hypothetical protein BGX31_002020 [Mortierella sp. GBA43]